MNSDSSSDFCGSTSPRMLPGYRLRATQERCQSESSSGLVSVTARKKVRRQLCEPDSYPRMTSITPPRDHGPHVPEDGIHLADA